MVTRFRDRQIWRTRSGNSAILAPKSSDQENPYLWNKSHRQFSYVARGFMPKILVYQTPQFGLWKNEYLMAKINVYHSLLPSDHVIGWDMKMTSQPNSNASFINIWDRLIWRRSPNLMRSPKLAAAPDCLGTNVNGILLKIYTFSLKKMHLKMLSGNLRPFCLCLNVLRNRSAYSLH